MARQRRIEYGGAIYHVMARGDRREDIFYSDEDRKLYLETLGEACQQTGWRVHGWVLMDNHYHLALETPEPNLVAGMKWLQNTYTRRFNSRHKLWGHVFGGRYRAILCEDDSKKSSTSANGYFLNLVDYIHLNPYRAGMVHQDKGRGLLEYRWSSLAQTYGVPPAKRHKWSRTEKVLTSFGGKDCSADRRKYVNHLERTAQGQTEECMGAQLPDEQSLNSTLQRGWYWGSQKFQEQLLKRLKAQSAASNRNYRSSGLAKKHGEVAAKKILKKGLKLTGWSAKELKALKGSEPSKVYIAKAIRGNSTVSLAWVAEKLYMKSAANVSQQIKRMRCGEIQKPAWAVSLDKFVKN